MAEQVDGAKPVDGAPAQELPSRPAKQPKEKAAKGGNKNAGLEVRRTRNPSRVLSRATDSSVFCRFAYRARPQLTDLCSDNQLPELPEYIQHRIDLFDQIKAKYDAEVAGM